MEPFGQQHHFVSVVLFFFSLMIFLMREASALAKCCPGLWMREKSNLDRKRDQCACRQFRFWDVWKYGRFLWSFRSSIMCIVPSRMCLHSSRPHMTDRTSLSWISC